MRVILDSDIRFSASISSSGPPDRIYQAWRSKRFDPIACPTQIEEIRRASRYQKLADILKRHGLGRMINELQSVKQRDPPPTGHETADPNDAWLLALAEAAQSDYLVKGDKRAGLLSRGHLGFTRIATATAFCRDGLGKRP